MVKEEHLSVLRQGSVIWNEWRERNPEVTPIFRDADLSGADLRQAELARADFAHAYLIDTNLFAANLAFANLSSAFIKGANFADAFLLHTDLSGAVIIQANFTGAFLYDANLTRAHLEATVFGNTVLQGTIFGATEFEKVIGLDRCLHSGPSIIDFHTLQKSPALPLTFLRGCGLPDIVIDYLPSLQGHAIQFHSCFISYSFRDQVFSEKLHADLQNKGVRCWFASHDLPIGAKTWDAIDEAIRLRDKLVVILSKASIASDWVEDEVSKAYAEERSRKEVVLFPIRIDNAVMSSAEPWAVKLRDQRNIGDFRQWRRPAEYQKSLKRLLRDLRASAAK